MLAEVLYSVLISKILSMYKEFKVLDKNEIKIFHLSNNKFNELMKVDIMVYKVVK